jgi:two-component system, response regulator PdtaR
MLILIVEDEPITAMSAAWELEQAGHRVLEAAATVDEALVLARKHRPDLALVDIDLHDTGNGVELARQLREMDIPSLFVSAQDSLANHNSNVALGFIGKPYHPADIPRSVEVIRALLRGEVLPPLPRALHLYG